MSVDNTPNSAAWLFFVKLSFVVSLGAMIGGILFMHAELTVKAYLALCGLFLVNATITLSKTLRDEHEGQRLLNRISEARTQKILKEFTE